MAKKKEKDSTPEPRKVRSPDVTESGDDFRRRFDRTGTTRAEGGERILEIMQAAEEGEADALEAPDRELLEMARERAKESGTVEDAVRALALGDRAQEAEEVGQGSEPEAVPFETLAEETGLSPDAVTVTAKVDGEAVEIPLSEALKGYQRHKDYTRKTQELADQRQEVQQLQESYAQQLEMLAVTLGQSLGPEQQKALAAEYERVVGEIQGQVHGNLSEVVEAEQGKLRESFNWTDDSEWNEARGQLREYAHSLGFSDAELQGVHDHRVLAVLEKARRYEEGISRAEEVRSRAKGDGPTALKPGTPAMKRKGSSKHRESAWRQLQKTGSANDAARLIGILGTDDL